MDNNHIDAIKESVRKDARRSGLKFVVTAKHDRSARMGAHHSKQHPSRWLLLHDWCIDDEHWMVHSPPVNEHKYHNGSCCVRVPLAPKKVELGCGCCCLAPANREFMSIRVLCGPSPEGNKKDERNSNFIVTQSLKTMLLVELLLGCTDLKEQRKIGGTK